MCPLLCHFDTITHSLQLEFISTRDFYTLPKHNRNSIGNGCHTSAWINYVRHLTACDFNYFEKKLSELNRNVCSLLTRYSTNIFFIHFDVTWLNSIMDKKISDHFHDYRNNEHFSAVHYINGSGNNGTGHWSDYYVFVLAVFWNIFSAYSYDDDYTTITAHIIIIINGVDSVANRTHKSRLN